MSHWLAVFGLGACVVACDATQRDATTADAAQKNKPVYDALVEPLDQAKQAEKQVFDGAERQKKQADEL